MDSVRPVVFLLLLCLVFPLPGRADTAVPPELNEEIDSYFANLDAAMANHRVEMAMGLFTANAREVFQRHPPRVLRYNEIRAALEKQMATYASPDPAVRAAERASRKLKMSTLGQLVIEQTLFEPYVSGPRAIGVATYQFERSETGLKMSVITTRLLVDDVVPNAAPKIIPRGADGLPTEVTLTNGVTLHHVKAVQWFPDKVVLKHMAGTDPIRFDFIVEEQRQDFSARAQDGMNRQLQEYQAAAQQNEARRFVAESIQAGERERQEQADRLEHAVSEHRLLVGMTMDQVRRSWGSPSRVDQIQSASGGDSALWFYDGRGIDDRGNPANAGVGFEHGRVEALFNVKQR